MARYQRIVSISNFEIKQLEKQAKDKTIDATFELTAYYVSAESLQKAAAPAPKPGTPAPAAPPAQPPAPAK